MRIRRWLGFEGEDHEGSSPAEYSDCVEDSELSEKDEVEHREYVRRVAAEHEFPLSNWAPTIPSRTRS